jgi:predicted GTPase
VSKVDADAMRRYETARDALVCGLNRLEPLLEGERRASLQRARLRLARGKFVLAVVGEFSSGKSFLLNALLGKVRYDDRSGGVVGLLETDINPSTATIAEIEYGDRDEATAFFQDGRSERIPLDSLGRFVAAERDPPSRVAVRADSPFLQRGFVVADTPGLASIDPAHRKATLDFLPSADAVLYLIDTQQPFSEGDAAFLGIVRRHIDSIFIVQTKIDLWRRPDADGVPEWQRANERIARLAALHAPGTYVYALSAREYVGGLLDGDPAEMERSRFPAFLAALDASLITRTGRARLVRAAEAARAAADDERSALERDLAALAMDAGELARRREAVLPELARFDRASQVRREGLLARGAQRRLEFAAFGRTLADDLERELSQAFDTADVARLRDRERLAVVVDRVVAAVAGQYARSAAEAAIEDVESALHDARSDVALRWAPADAAARAFGAEPGTSLWSGDPRDAIAATIVLGAIGGPAIALVADIGPRFSSKPPGAYMKRELLADLRAEIFPRLRAEAESFAGDVATKLTHVYDDLAQALARAAIERRDADLGSIDRALRAHAAGEAAARTEQLIGRRANADSAAADIDATLTAFLAHGADIGPADAGPAAVRAAHAEPAFDKASYDRGLRPERWRVAVLGGLRRGKSSLIDAFAERRVLGDDAAGSARFPVHVRYGERPEAYALTAAGDWEAMAFDSVAEAAASTAVLALVPWSLPSQLVMVHAPAFDSGEPHADDVDVAVAAHASEVVCLFSRQLSDRELDLYQRVSELGRPMTFVHTMADNEAPSERRHVAELAAEYLKRRSIPVERIFVVSAHEYAEARRAGRAPAGWNEMEALRATLEAHAEAHMHRLERRAAAGVAGRPESERAVEARPRAARGLLARVFGKGR